MKFKREVVRVDFSYVQKKPGESGLKLITMLINFSKNTTTIKSASQFSQYFAEKYSV